MTREELSHYEVMLLSQGITGIQKAIHMEIAYNLYLSELQATIEAQEIIIKDKTAIMEAMTQPKTCEGCKHDKTNSYGRNHCQYEFNCIRQQVDCYEPKAQP